MGAAFELGPCAGGPWTLAATSPLAAFAALGAVGLGRRDAGERVSARPVDTFLLVGPGIPVAQCDDDSASLVGECALAVAECLPSTRPGAGAGSVALESGGGALGWVLLLDTFALWPFSLYAFGFSPAAVLVVALCAVVPWVIGSTHNTWRLPLVLLGGVLWAHVVLRLPTGNVWDALLDPWLWAALQLAWLPRVLRVIQRRLKGA